MKIRKLQLKGVGVFADETIAFEPCPARDKAEIHIFTGPNGSGKTTLLMALASGFDYFAPHIKSPHNFFDKRFTDAKSSRVTICFDEGEAVSVRLNASHRLAQTDDNLTALNYRQLAHDPERPPQEELSFAVFAYSGYRYIAASYVDAVRDYRENPLLGALEFVRTLPQPPQFTINQWIANNLSMRAIAKEQRRNVAAQTFAKNIRNLEQALSEIISDKIEFELDTTQPLNLVVKTAQAKLDFDVLPDGLRSLISWLGDLLMRLDFLKWQADAPVFGRNIILLLDEIEVHLHPAWQRRVLPVVQKLFPNAQIFISSHSPFVVNSVDDAWIYKLAVKQGAAHVAEVIGSEDGRSYGAVLRETFDVEEEFGLKVQTDLEQFYKLRNSLLKNGSATDAHKTGKKLLKVAKTLALQSEELNTIVQLELRQINRRTGQQFAI